MAKRIQRVAVLGAGVMGAGIAAHLANAGIESILYDIVPEGASDAPAGGKARNALALKGIEAAIKSKPALLYRRDLAQRITPANFEDHGDLLDTCDWIVEVVVERLDIKQKVFAWVAEHAAPDAIVSSNTSGISLAEMAAGMPEDLRRRFLVTHFFNPVRYMRLLELVAGPDTDPAVVDRIATFGERVLGKGIVYGKDTPNFVANRIGTWGMASVFHHMQEIGLGVEAVDGIFGPAMARPKSAVFRTADVVGLDTLGHVFSTVREKTEGLEAERFTLPAFAQELVKSGRTGQKAGAGFYKKVKESGKSVILALDLETMDYRPAEKPRFPSVGAARKADTPTEGLKALVYGDDDAARLAWAVTADTLIYAAEKIPEIADDVVNIDRGMRWGFAWDLGPFEVWDAIGVRESLERMKTEGRTVPAWVEEMLAAGRETFYARTEDGTLTYWQREGGAAPVPRSERHLMVADRKVAGARVGRNPSASLVDLGDGALLLEFTSKLNALDELIFDQYDAALDKLDAGEFEALVVGNQDPKAFSAGANILMILMASMQQDWAAIEKTLDRFQSTLMRALYHERPIVTAPHGLTLGGGAEVAMHGAAAVATGETYMGLVEVGVGLIPGAGGCKELILRHLGETPQDIDYDPNPAVQKVFERIGLGKVATSAEEARAWGYLRRTDKLVLDPDAVLKVAKDTALGLARGGWQSPAPRTAKLPGRSGLAAIEAYLHQMHDGGFATAHDVTVGRALGRVLTGGDVPAGTVRTEQDLLDLERESFLSLCGEPKTQERIQHMLQKGKPLRN